MKTHDYTVRAWGHDFTVMAIRDRGQRIQVTGWGYGIEPGDFILLPTDDGSTRYQVFSITYRVDPSDMWTAELHFAPRTQEAAHHD